MLEVSRSPGGFSVQRLFREYLRAFALRRPISSLPGLAKEEGLRRRIADIRHRLIHASGQMDDKKHLILAGYPGCGKTAFLNYQRNSLGANTPHFHVVAENLALEANAFHSDENISPTLIFESALATWAVGIGIPVTHVQSAQCLKSIANALDASGRTAHLFVDELTALKPSFAFPWLDLVREHKRLRFTAACHINRATAEFFGGNEKHEDVQFLFPRPLTIEEIHLFLSETLAIGELEVSQEASSRLWKYSGGNPYEALFTIANLLHDKESGLGRQISLDMVAQYLERNPCGDLSENLGRDWPKPPGRLRWQRIYEYHLTYKQRQFVRRAALGEVTSYAHTPENDVLFFGHILRETENGVEVASEMFRNLLISPSFPP